MSDWGTIADLFAEKDRQRMEQLDRQDKRERRTYMKGPKCGCGRSKRAGEATCFRCREARALAQPEKGGEG